MKTSIIFLAIIFFAFACSENNDTTPQTPAAKRELAIATAVAKQDPTRIIKVTKFLFQQDHNAAHPLLKEIVAIDQSTGKKSLAYIVTNEPAKETSSGRTECGSISGGWMLMNNGCWYHGTLFTGCNGDSIFVMDQNPYIDNYIGNEPKCMSDSEFDSIA
jgi:hypothetical protein